MTTENVLYFASNLEDWIDAASIMSERHGWDPVYWVGSPSIEDQVRSSFPNIVYQYKREGARGVAPAEYSDAFQYPLDVSDLTNQAINQIISMKMMDRMDPGNIFNNDQRFRNHVRLLMFWKNVLESESIDRVIFELPPHVVLDYVLYIACKQSDIDTVMLKEAISLPGFVYSQSEIGELPTGLAETIDSTGNPNIPPQILDYVREIGKRTPETTNKNPGAQASQEIVSTVQSTVRIIKNAFPNPKKIQNTIPNTRIKKPRTNIENSEYSYLEHKFLRAKSEWALWKLNRSYSKHSSEANFSERYIYFPLHYQPELTTSPQGGVYSHQLLAANLLSCYLPDGWKIYIKEHPLQLSKRKGIRGRKIDHYRNLQKLDSVELVNMSTDQIRLIDNSEVVATITGTSGWEAIVRGIPTIVFGNAWYRRCEGVFYTRYKKDLKSAISDIEAGYSIDQSNVKKFMQALVSIGYEGYVLSGGQKDYPRINSEDNVRGIVNQLESHI